MVPTSNVTHQKTPMGRRPVSSSSHVRYRSDSPEDAHGETARRPTPKSGLKATRSHMSTTLTTKSSSTTSRPRPQALVPASAWLNCADCSLVERGVDPSAYTRLNCVYCSPQDLWIKTFGSRVEVMGFGRRASPRVDAVVSSSFHSLPFLSF